uniref:Large ribosomal subunit protein bL32c n=1 Tax=Eleocharis dulcis TaxID=110284 RepID=A0A6H1XHF0_9POAL|nr:ribosomal protein L32 [Eleocharis dulcis]QJA15057.1 ribosomal protein L32 [Eleocharis dulcis]
MAVPKKRTSMSKKRIRRNIWRKKGYFTLVKVSSLIKSLSIGNSNSFVKKKPNKRAFGFCVFLQKNIPIIDIN